jgi:hypothetical protein
MIGIDNVLSMHTFDSAYHVFPYVLHLALLNPSKPGFTLASIA